MPTATPSPKSDAIAGPLYELLRTKLPCCCGESGTLQVATLADRLAMSPEGVYRWLRANEVSKRGRKRLVDLGSVRENLTILEAGSPTEDPLTEDDLRPFS